MKEDRVPSLFFSLLKHDLFFFVLISQKRSMNKYKIAISKHQITNKSQISIFNDQNMFGILNFGHCNLFGICIL